MVVSRRRLWVLGVFGAVVTFLLMAFAADRVAQRGRVLRRVEVGDLDLSGQTPEAARRALSEEAQRLGVVPLGVTVAGHQLRLDPSDVGARADVDRMLQQAVAAGRRGWIPGQLFAWLRGVLGGSQRIAWEVTVDPAALEGVLSSWDRAVGAPGREASLDFHGADVQPVYPQEGRRIDRQAAGTSVARALSLLPRPALELPLTAAHNEIAREEVDRAAAAARNLLSAPVTITAADATATLSPAEVGGLLRAYTRGHALEITVDVSGFSSLVTDRLGRIERRPRSADWEASGDDVRVVPAEDGLQLDATATVGPFVASLARRDARVVAVPVRHLGATRTTRQAEALHIDRRVSSFATSHAPGAPRVQNIHRIADILQGTIVAPGETLSVNRAVGQRTREAGYVEAPVIYDSEYKTDVGGGVSQFATTLFNAVYFGGYRIDSATAHAFYISRYPVGRDATLSYPDPDLVFTNDSAAGMLIRTSYSDTEITVTVYGDNGGKQVEAVTGEPYDIVAPKTVYRPDPEVPPGRQYRQQAGANGFTIQVTRVIRNPGGKESRSARTTVYSAPDEIILVNPEVPPTTAPPMSGTIPGG